MPNEDNLKLIADGQTARMVRGYMEDMLINHEEDILEGLVKLYEADQLSNDYLRAAIGEIAGVRRMRTHLENAIRRGTAAAEIELGEDSV